jgi:hypothetical protein
MSLAAIPASSPLQSTPREARVSQPSSPESTQDPRRAAADAAEQPQGGDVAGSDRPDTRETGRERTVRQLTELVAALDRRVPHVERAGEVSIAQAAAQLRADALKRVEELQREPAPDVQRPEKR